MYNYNLQKSIITKFDNIITIDKYRKAPSSAT